MPLYIFSDSHLGAGTETEERHKTAQIIKLCELVKSDGDRLIILGDLFDFWFEYKHVMPKQYMAVLFALHELKNRGVQIDYVSGNHDFWMDDFFEKQLDITVHRDSLETTYAGKKLFLTHGDGLAQSDWGYRILKRILRNRFNIWLYRKLPPDWAFPLAKKVSGTSRHHSAQRDHVFAPEYRTFAIKKLDEGFDLVAIAHLHIPYREEFGNKVYINTGDFIHHFTYVKVTDGTVVLEKL